MGRIFDLESPFMRFLNLVGDLMILNFGILQCILNRIVKSCQYREHIDRYHQQDYPKRQYKYNKRFRELHAGISKDIDTDERNEEENG